MPRSFVSSFLLFATLCILSGCGGGTTLTQEPAKPAANPSTPDASPTPPVKPVVAPEVKPSGRKVIALILKSTTHEFWKQIGEGAQEAVKGHDLDIVIKAAEPADQPDAQLALVDQMLAQKVEAIVLAPVHPKFLVQAVDKCFEAKVPLVIIDSGVDAEFTRYTAFVGTDNKDGGAKCAKALAEALGKKGEILLFRNKAGDANIAEREEGFIEAIKKDFQDVKIAQEKFAGATREETIKSASEFVAANSTFQGVFASNESGAVAMLAALREKGLAGKVKFVAFDSSKILLDAVRSGEIEALEVQNPKLIGSESVTQAINAIEHKKVDASIVIPATLKDKAALKLEDEIRLQEENDKKREAELKLIQEEQDKLNAEKIKQFEAETAKAKEELRLQEIEEKKREAELKRLVDANDQQNAAKLKEIEEAQKKYKEDLAARQEADAKRELELKKMKEDFDKKTEEQRQKIDAEQKAQKK